MTTTVGALAEVVGGSVQGNPSQPIDDLAGLVAAGPRDISFLSHPRYLESFYRTRAGAVLVRDTPSDAPCATIVCDDPYLAMAKVASVLHPPPIRPPGADAGAWVHPEAMVDATASIATGAIIEQGVQIGARTHIGCGCIVASGARIGADTLLYPGVKVLSRCEVGAHVILHSGVVIGSDGFGFAPDGDGRRHKIPQVGIVVIDDHVEVGANTTIDRATFGQTRVGAGTKIDNLVQIAHNVVIGRDCVIVSQAGIAGSTTIGDRVVIGAQAGINGHIQITDDVMLGGRAGVIGSIETSGVYSGLPIMPHRQWLRVASMQSQLPEMRRRLRALEARLEELSL